MIHDEVPRPIAVALGHVCGVIAVGLAALSVWGIWLLAHKPSWIGLAWVSPPIVLTVLMFRWAGVLTGYWDTRGRPSLPRMGYAVLGYVFAGFGAAGVVVVSTTTPAALREWAVLVLGLVGTTSIAYWCFRMSKRGD